MIKVSIIIPVYNVSNYIARCLESVFLQECQEAAVECILVDDCSLDDSMAIAARMIDEYVGKGGKIQFEMFSLPENRGHCAARNIAARIASGDYFLFLDADDYLLPNSVKYFIEELNSVDGQVEVVMANAISSRDNRPLSKITQKQLIDNSDEYALSLVMNRILTNTSWNKLVKAKVFMKYGLYFSEGIINEDLLWSYMLFLHARNILLLPQTTYVYENNNQKSITNTIVVNKLLLFIRSRIFICNQIFINPPQIISSDYYGYLYCILHRMVDVLERHHDVLDAERNEVSQLKHRLLHSTWKSGFPLLCFLILTLYKPFYYIVKLKSFRCHFNFIIRTTVAASSKFHFGHSKIAD